MSSTLLSRYRFAKRVVEDSGYASEVSWQSGVSLDDMDESTFLRELAWVVLSAGMSERVIRGIFRELSSCFLDWESSEAIVRHERLCYCQAISVFGNKRKISAILAAAGEIHDMGFDTLKESMLRDPIDFLQKFPYIGPITAYHLAKNLGLPVAKPDRHLTRIAALEGYSDVQLFCDEISQLTGDSVPVVDIVLWRFATIDSRYLEALAEIDGECSMDVCTGGNSLEEQSSQ